MTTLIRWILAHKRFVVVAWLAVAATGLATTRQTTNALSQRFNLPGYEGFQTNMAIARIYGNGGQLAPLVPVIHLPAGTTIRSVRPQLAAAFAAVQRAVPHTRIASYANTGDSHFISRDGRTTFGLLFMPRTQGPDITPAQIARVQQALAPLRIAGAGFHLTGYSVLASTASSGSGPGVLAETLLGGLGALLVLLFVFRSFMALLPLFMAAVAIPTSYLLVWGLTGITTVNYTVEYLIALIGLGVALDYSLLIVLRWREERARGQENGEAVQQAVTRAGRAVVFSGSTVALSLLSLIVLRVPYLQSVGYAGLLIPLVSAAVSCTLLPVVLATIGPRLDWPNGPRREQPGRWWAAWSRQVVRLRFPAAIVGLALLGFLFSATGSLVLGVPRLDSLSSAGDAHVGLQTLERAGIPAGVLAPYEVLVPRAGTTQSLHRLTGLRGVYTAVAPASASWRRGGTALVSVLPAAELGSGAGHDGLGRVRAAVHTIPGAHTGGFAIRTDDAVTATYGSFPLMIALISLLTFVLLARAFRSLLLPLKAIFLNALSVGASFGVMVLVWQQGHGSQAIWGIPATNAITEWIPLWVFAFLFGLSMDYEVFILARMREEYDATGDTDMAVVQGIAHTGRLVTSAALILCLAFVSLASGPQIDIKVAATGLAAGILLDATVVRMLLVPALVSLFGRWNWWLPPVPARLLRVQPSPVHLAIPQPQSQTV